jgi:hypothetical protein
MTAVVDVTINGERGRRMHAPIERSLMRRVILAMIALSWANAPARAQIPTVWDDLHSGSRVRINGLLPTPKGDVPYEYTGLVNRIDSTRLYLMRPDRTSIDTLPYFAMQHLAMSTGFATRSDLQIKGALVGAVMGAAFWGFTKAVPGNDGPTIPGNPPSRKERLQRIALISIPGLALGGFLIASGTDREQWVGVLIPVPR